MIDAQVRTIVLVHGSWHDGTSWEQVARLLEKKGHHVYAPTLAGHGPTGDRQASHADAVRSGVDFITERDLRDVVLVGHSFGGSIIQRITEEIPDRIERTVFACAYVLLDGESVEDNFPEPVRDFVAANVDADGGVPLPFDLFRHGLFNDGTDEQAAAAFERMTPTPRRTLSDSVPIRAFFSLDLPKTYIVFGDDVSIPLDSEYYLPTRHAPRLSKYQQIEISGSHEALFTNPVGLADAIVESLHSGE